MEPRFGTLARETRVVPGLSENAAKKEEAACDVKTGSLSIHGLDLVVCATTSMAIACCDVFNTDCDM